MQLRRAQARPDREHADLDGLDPEAGRDPLDEATGGRLDDLPVVPGEALAEDLHHGPKPFGPGQIDPADPVTPVVELFFPAGKSIVVGERHRNECIL